MSQAMPSSTQSVTRLSVQWLRSFGMDVSSHVAVPIRWQGTLADVLSAHAHQNQRLNPDSAEWESLLAQTAKCRLYYDNAQWWLAHGGSQLRCVCQGVPMLANQSVVLHGGEMIDLGLQSFCIQITPLSDDADNPSFSLTDLDLANQVPSVDQQKSPIQAISASLSPKFEDSTDKSAGAVQTEVVNELFDPLAALHQRYLATLRDPLALTSLSNFKALDADAVDTSHAYDELLASAQASSAHLQLHDAITPQWSVERVMDGLDTLQGVHLLDPEPSADVLELFAPTVQEGPPAIDAPSHLAALLPSLTRKEHHGMAADSAMDLYSPAREEQPKRNAL
jgi:hypothetical protein